jgi:RNA polymerase sigma-32 factor
VRLQSIDIDKNSRRFKFMSLISDSTSNFFAPTIQSNIARSGSTGILQYLRQIQQFPILSSEEEHNYALRYCENGDKEAAKILVQSHLRLVVKIATKFKSYGFPLVDLISEGNLGLIQAVKKFDPFKGFRFSTYAMWWIRANIQEYILRSWSLVKIGTTVAQKKLFFNLHKIKKKLEQNFTNKNLLPEYVDQIAKDLNVSKKDVIDMNSRLQNSDASLNQFIDEDQEEEVINSLASNEDSQETLAIDSQEKSRQIEMLQSALSNLNPRERDIITKRQMSESPSTLEELSQIYNISRERIRQIEANALLKIKKEVAKMQKKFSYC